jgi:hypothetical protein
MNHLKKTLFITLASSSLLLNGCSSAPSKDDVQSDSRALLGLYHIDLYKVKDGVTPSKAVVGVNRAYAYSSAGTHVADFLAGGLTGLVTFGIMGSSTNSAKNREKTILDNPTLIMYMPDSKDISIEQINWTVNPFSYTKTPIFYLAPA